MASMPPIGSSAAGAFDAPCRISGGKPDLSIPPSSGPYRSVRASPSDGTPGADGVGVAPPPPVGAAGATGAPRIVLLVNGCRQFGGVIISGVGISTSPTFLVFHLTSGTNC